MSNRKKLMPQYGISFAVYSGALLLCGLLVFYIDYNAKKTILSTAETSIEQIIEHSSEKIKENIASSYHAINFFYATPPIAGIARAMNNNGVDPLDNTPIESWYTRLETVLKSYLENNQQIDQVRFIAFDEKGSELIRVEQVQGNVRIVSRQKMQGKANRDYFAYALKLNPGENYISPINLNREWNKIQHPYKPTYRVARAVFDENNKPMGFLIINISVGALLLDLRNTLLPNYEFFLLNPKNGFILHSQPDKDFGFEFSQEDSWPHQMTPVPSPYPRFKSVRMPSNDTLLYHDRTLELSEYVGTNTITLVAGITQSTFAQKLYERRLSTTALIIGVFLAFFTLLIYYRRQVHKNFIHLKEQAEYRAIINDSSDAVISMNAQGRIHSWNRAAENIFGYSENTAKGQNIFTLLLNDESALFSTESLVKIYRGQPVPAFDAPLHNSLRSSLTVSVTLSPIIMSDNGSVEGVAAILRDVTEQKITEQQILEMNTFLEAEVARRTLELEKAKDKALALSQLKSNFIANVSHEIRTPMNGVIGMLHLIGRESLSDSQNQYLEMANRSATALTNLVNDILDLSKIEAGKLVVESHPLDLYRLLGETCSSLAVAAKDKNIDFIVDLAGIAHNQCEGDSHRIRQILINLVGNAIKFTRKGHIIVKANTQLNDNDTIDFECSVIDTGVGIEADNLPKLFHSFSQEDDSTARFFGGTGLGLAISKNLSNMMGGDIVVSSTKDVGSTFTFSLCLSADTSVQPLSLEQPEYKKIKCVIVQDHETIHTDALQATLKVLNLEYFCINAQDQQALQLLFKTDQSTLVFYDQSIPNITTANATDQADKNHHNNGNKKLVFIRLCENLSSNIPAQEGDIKLGKPFTPRDVCCAINNALIALGITRASEVRTEPNISSYEDEIKTRFAGYHILLVDDNEINLEVGKGILEDLGLAVTLADNGQRALDELTTNRMIKLVLMDCQMPDMDGFETTHIIRNGGAGNHCIEIPILAMTANAMSGSKESCLAQGMNDYIPKPINPEQLTEKLLLWFRPIDNAEKATSMSQKYKLLPPLRTKKETDTPEALTPIWCEQECNTRLRGRTDRIMNLMDRFIQNIPERLAKLEMAITQRDTQQVSLLAHEIKGVAGNLSARLMAQICTDLEAACEADDTDRMDAIAPLLMPCYQSVNEHFLQYKSKHSNAAPLTAAK